MGIPGALKGIYYKGEDAWYAFWDRVDSKIPVYGAIEKIDKIIPSFALFLLIIVALALFFSWGFIGGFFVQANFSVLVVDSEENPLPNAQIDIKLGDKNIFSGKTNEFGQTIEIQVPLNSRVKIFASKDGFEEATKDVLVEMPNQRQQISLIAEEIEKEITVLVKGKDGLPITEAVVVSFACRNTGVSAPSEMTIASGRLTVIEPKGCGGLLASIDSPKYQKINSKPLQVGSQTIFLSLLEDGAPSTTTGTLRIELKFSNALVSEPITVNLYKDNGAAGLLVDTKISANGIAEFTKAPGTYFAKTSATSKYGQAVSGKATVEAGKTATLSLALLQNIAGKIKLQIKDETSKQTIPGAQVSLQKENTEIESKKTDQNGIAEFSVMENTEYKVIVDSNAYCLKVLSGVRISESVQPIELKKFSGECGGTLKVKIIDQDAKKVKGAIVGLYSEEGYNTGFANRISDLNGIAEFTRVPSGTYKAFALKGGFSGWSDAADFQQRLAEQTLLIVTMVIPNGTLRIKVIDTDGNPMPGANVLFLDSTTLEKIGSGTRPVEDINGIIEFVSRADKKIYFVVSKKGFADFTSVSYPILPSTTQGITAVMEKEIISGEIKIEFVGLYKGNEIATVLAPGETYTAKLKIKIPSNKDYKKIGVHLRVGNSSKLELDPLVLKEINSFGRPTVIKATAFNPSSNYEEDVKTVTADDAKWINAEWAEFSTGITSIEATIRVKETANVSDELVFWYRTFAVDSQGRYIRDKEDRQLGTSENTNKKQALYAEAYQKAYNIGTETLCDETFCFAASILDIEEGISQSATSYYNAKLFKDYELKFAILNSAESQPFYESELKITNPEESLIFGSYEISGAQNQGFSATADAYEIGWLEIGDLLENTSAKGTTLFSTQKTSNSTIKFQIRSAQRIVFEKTIAINVEAKKELSATIAPELLPSGIENKITVTVFGKETGLEIEEALVKIQGKFRNMLSSANTNSKGMAILTLPAQQPGEKLFLIIEKPEYKPFEKEILVDDKVALLKPDKIGIALNVKTMPEAEAQFSIENKSGFELSLTELQFEADLKGLIDAQKAKNWLDTFLGETISAKQAKAFSLKASLTELGRRIGQTKTIEGKLKATLSALGGSWEFEVPVVISIGLGGEVDDPNCFKITKREWKGITEGQTIQIELEIQNNCAVNSNPVPLNDIEAQITWQGSELGTFSVITEQSQIDLVSGYFKRIAGRIEPEQKINAKISFAPNMTTGAIAKADIIFRASNPTETAIQELTDKLNAQITVTNLLDCIGFGADIITIKPEGTGTFTIETMGCGENTDFRLESELELGKKTVSLKDKDKAQIDVFAQGAMAGQYVVSIFAKGSGGGTQEKFIKNIRVRVQSKGCIEISKFEFDVFKNPEDAYSGYDTANLTNHCYDKIENIEVKWSEKDMGKAEDTGMQFAMMMGMANMMGQKGGTSQIFNSAVSGGTTDYCMLAGGTVLYQQNGNFYDSTGKQVAAPAPGMCHPWQKVNIYDPSGKVIETRFGYLNGSTLLQSNGQPYTDITWANNIFTKNVPSVPSAPAATPAIPPAAGPTPTIAKGEEGALPSIGFAAAAAPSGTYAGRPTTPTGTVIEPPSTASSENKAKKEQESLSQMNMMANPMMFGLMQMGGGEPNFLASAMQGYLMGTQWAYSQQKEGAFSYEAVVKDLVYKTSKLLMPGAKIEEGKYSEELSTDIAVKDIGEKSLEQSEENPALNIEKRKLAFTNEAGVVQQDPSKPLFRVLQVRGERIEYETKYEYDEEQMPETITTKSTKKYVENFRLQFNAFNPVSQPIEPGPVPNCQLGTMSGVTGEKAVPRVLLNWDWSSIKENSCDETNPNYSYCDAVQFSIAVLKKLEKLRQFIEKHSPFDCPTGETAASVKEQQLADTAFDAGITRIQAQKSGADANIVVTMESSNKKEMQGSLTIKILDSNNAAIASKTVQFKLLSKEIVSQTFTAIPQGDYGVEASITLQLCEACENNDAANDKITAKLNMTSFGVGKCTPRTTKRLQDFLEATEFNGNASWTQAEKDEILKLVNFNALLIKDAYPDDFRNDFHEFCINKSFFDCPETYKKQQGWGEFFKSKEKFKFDYGLLPNAPLSAGKYNVILNVEFENDKWNFFENSAPSAKITVEMAHLETPKPDSPFYYLPFDGKIGEDSENGRQGYGVNYKQETEGTVQINNSSSQIVRTTNIASSTPVFGAWVSGALSKSFKTINNDKRGILLEIKAGEDSTSISLSPSYATPVIMKVSYSKGENAFGFYSVEIDNSPQTNASRMIPWNGIGINCKDFKDVGMADAWQNTWDIHGGITGNVKCALGTQITDYGLEWCNPSRTGDVYLWGIVFTPQGSNSIMKRKTYADSMQLIGTESSGAQISLNGVPGQAYNSFGISQINSVEDVLRLVKEERVCIIGIGNRASNQFFWNPKPVIDALDAKKQEFEKTCIPAK